MFKAIATFMFICLATQASAQSCPDFYRFFDFGIEGKDGTYYRSGPTFRAESLGGTPMLLRDRTLCRNLQEIASDGHGNPIPVVTSVSYNPAKTGVDLTELHLSLVPDATALAAENAQTHRAALQQSGAQITRGADFLCTQAKGASDVSCQLVSPYNGNADLVVYCSAESCTMPVLAMTKTARVAATWSIDEAALENPTDLGPQIAEKIMQIYDFLETLS